MAINKELLTKVIRTLRRIKHEEHYNQATWAMKTPCGTAACIAGFIVMRAGYRLKWNRSISRTATCYLPGGDKPDLEDIQYVALKEANIPDEDGMNLFSGKPYEDWPKEYRNRWLRRHEAGERASRIAADLLQAVIDTDGEILRKEA